MLQISCVHCRTLMAVPEELVGQQVPCARCGKSTQAQTATATFAAAPLVSPPTANGAEPAEDGEEQLDEPEPISWWFLGGLVFVVLLGLSAGAIGAIAFLRWYQQAQIAERERIAAQTAAEEGDEEAAATPSKEWVNAKERPSRISGISVQVNLAEVGQVHFQSAGEVQATDENFLIVSLTILNRSRDTITYRSWYSYKFEEGDQTVAATCVDMNGTEFEIYPIANAERIERHDISEEPLARHDRTTDTLIFRIPADYSQDFTTDLHLTLPGAAVDNGRPYKFLIPVDMIQKR